MQQIIVLQGIPGSGKTTWARDFVAGKNDWVRINRDDLRNMRGDYWVPNQEKLITEIEFTILDIVMREGYNVIFDSTNLNPKTIKKIENIVKLRNDSDSPHKYEVEYKVINTPVEICIERDSKREKPVGAKIIKGFYNRYKDILENAK